MAADRGREFAFAVGGSPGHTFTPAGGIARFHDWFGDDAPAQIAERTEAAHKGIPLTLAAIKKIAEST